MHEYSVTRALVDLCEQEAQHHHFSRIYKINIKIGKFTGFSSDSIQFYFDFLKPETKCREAIIVFEEIPVRLRCSQCNRESTIGEPLMICPACGSTDIEVLSGREFYVESIEGE